MRVSRAIRSRVAQSIVVLSIIVVGHSFATLNHRTLATDAEPPRIAASGLRRTSAAATAATVTLIDNPAPAIEGRFGGDVAGIGDVTGDGVPDFAVSAYGNEKVYIFSGRDRTLIREINDPDGPFDEAMRFGFALAAVGDVSGDGVPDLAVSAPGSAESFLPVPCAFPPCPAEPDSGRAFVFSGATGELLRRLPAPPTDGSIDSLTFGHSLATLGDINSDGVTDVAVGDPYADLATPNGGLVAAFSGADGVQLWLLHRVGGENGWLGATLATLDDLNGDGTRDLLAGAPFGGINRTGRVYVLSGADGAILRTHDSGSDPGDIYSGVGLADIGDQDADGINEYVVGERAFDQVQVFRGSDGGLIRTLNISPSPEGPSGFGARVANVGDKDDDGRDDFWVSAPSGNSVYLLNQTGTILAQASDPTPPAMPLEEVGFGWRLAAIADVGGDCGADLLVGEHAEPSDDGSGGTLMNAGVAYVVTLAQTGVPPVINNFAPLVAVPGASVTITGTGLTGATSVTFGAVSAGFIVDSDTQITATVPAGFILGQIRIAVGGCTATSANNFHVATDGALLDTTFNGTGKQTTNFFSDFPDIDLAHAVAIQPDGSIVVAGGAYTGPNCVEFAIARYLPNGSLDGSFGTLGRVTTDFSGACDTAYAVAIQPDGKIVVAGSTQAGAAANDFALARYNTNGSLDDGTGGDSTPGDSFGTGGKVITGFNFASSDDTAYSIALQADGKIVAAGTARGDDYALARYNTDGSLDTNTDADPATHFDIDGKLTTSFSAVGNEFARAVAVQLDGKIIAAGYSVTLGNITLARYNTNGSLDDGTISDLTPGDSFGSFGKVITDFGATDQAYAMVVRPNGKILVGGSSAATGTNANFALARYNADGSPDTTFNNGTGQRTDDFFGFHDRVYGLAVQTNGKIVAAGYASTDVTNGSDPDQSDFAVARYHADGSLDNTFDTDGKVTTIFSNVRDEAFAVAIQSDGKIVAAGIAKSADQPDGTNYDFAVARYLGDVVPPGEVQFSDATYSVGENGGTATITVTRADSGPGSVTFSTNDGTATAGPDYTATSLTLNFVPGETSKSFTVAITEDNDFEGNETVNLALTSPTGSASLGILSTAALTIIDNDAAEPTPTPTPTATPTPTPTPTPLPTPTPTPTPTSSVCSSTAPSDEATVSFTCVAPAGASTFTPIDPSSAGTLPDGFTLCATCPAFDITTTAEYSPPVTVCFAVPASIDEPTFSTLKLMHGESGLLVDRTTGRFTDSKSKRWVCGSVETLSPFALAQGQTPTATDGTISGLITDQNGNPLEGTAVQVNGTQNRLTITDAFGKYRFDSVETNGLYTVTPSRANFVFSPSARAFSQLGNHTEAVFTGAFTGDAANPLDAAEYFVRQQYVDILGREPDEGGFNYWSNEINRCGSDLACRDARRRDIAAAFFIEQEFQDTGSFIYNLYQSSLGRRPGFAEYAADRRQVVGGPGLETQKEVFAQAFVQRTEFMERYQANTTAASFVDALLQSVWQTSGVDLSSRRNDLIGRYHSGADMIQSRGLVMRALADDPSFKQSQYNAAFVLTEYFGYLRRDAEPEGYNFWLNVLNNREPGNFRGMVCSFITSTEYQKRFSSVVTRSNAECGR